MLLTALALAHGAPTVPDPVPPYPAELPFRLGDPRWRVVQRRADKVADTGAVLTIASSVGAATGTGMVALGADARGVGMVGGVVQLASAPGLVLGPPLLLSGSLRSARALRESGVHAPQTAGIVGWTLYGLTPILLATFNQGPDGDRPTDRGMLPLLSYGGALGMGLLQVQVNRRVARRARLPPESP